MTTSWGITLLWSLLKGEKMQVFIATGRVAFIPNDAVGRTPNGHVSFKFEFVCDSSMTDDTNKTKSLVSSMYKFMENKRN